MTHTAGPWHWQPGRGVRQIKLKRDHWEVGVAVQGGKGIALVFGEDEANATLIAAAPDLLEACRAMEAVDDHIAECEEGCGDGQAPEACEVGFPLADRARQLRCAAILKATGSI